MEAYSLDLRERVMVAVEEGVVTAMVTEGAMNRLLFHGFVEKFLVPELRSGDIVVMDNLSSHKAS